MKKANGKFTGHDRRVTLHLGYLSKACTENAELHSALSALAQTNFDLKSANQETLEAIYAEFDDALEAKIRGEFQADPNFLIDLGHDHGICPLCSHPDCRFIFRLVNNAGGKEINCGSRCIITYGISVKGAETAEQAKKLLEVAIRNAIKKVKIAEWHEKTGFKAEWIEQVISALREIKEERNSVGNYKWNYAKRQEIKSLIGYGYKLQAFYGTHNWLSKGKWEIFRKLCNTVEAHSAVLVFPALKPWADLYPVPVKETVEAIEQTVAIAAEESPAKNNTENEAPVIPAPVFEPVAPAVEDQMILNFSRGVL